MNIRVALLLFGVLHQANCVDANDACDTLSAKECRASVLCSYNRVKKACNMKV